MLGIGIRIADLRELIADVDRNSGLSETAGSSARAALASVNLPITPALVLERVSDDLHSLRARLEELLQVMLEISWNGPQSLGDLLLVDPLDLPIDWALGVIERRFAQLDTASEGGRPDGHVSGDDLGASILTGVDAELDAAILRAGFDPLAWKVLDTGGDADQARDGTFSRKDLRRVRSKGVEGVDLSEFLDAVATVERDTAMFDTAAHGGRGDRRFATSDLQAALRSESLTPASRSAAQLLLDHDELLPLLDNFAVHHANVALRLAKALPKPALRLLAFSGPLPFAVSLFLDPEGTLLLPFRVVAGAANAALSAGVALSQFAVIAARLNDPLHPRASNDEIGKLLRAIRYLTRHPGLALEVAIDLEMLEDDPDRWLGGWLPTLLTGGAGRAVGVPLKLQRALAVRVLTSDLLTAGQILLTAEERSGIERLPQPLTTRDAALRAALDRRRKQTRHPKPNNQTGKQGTNV